MRPCGTWSRRLRATASSPATSHGWRSAFVRGNWRRLLAQSRDREGADPSFDCGLGSAPSRSRLCAVGPVDFVPSKAIRSLSASGEVRNARLLEAVVPGLDFG